jgi:uncharacterized membrane protein YdjX (TVP38/TMEM64 family)
VISSSSDRAASAQPGTTRSRLYRIVPLAVLVALTGLVLVMGWHRDLSLETLARYHVALERFVNSHWFVAFAGFVTAYVIVVTLSIPGAVYLTVSGGVLFGVVGGTLASFAGATIGATFLFLVARTAFGEHLARRAGPLAERLADGFRKDAFSYLLFLRLVPVFPFFLVNLVPAIVGVRLAPFVAATAIGIVPATIVFTLVGAGLDSVIAAQEASFRACLAAGHADCRIAFNLDNVLTPKLIAALAGLGVLALLPVALRHIRARRFAGRAD